MTIMIGVCGSGDLQGEHAQEIYQKAENIGREIAKNKAVLICGGKDGIMEAACKGAKQENGLTIGILPYSRNEKNAYVDVPIVTGIGEKRNAVIVQSADCIIAIAGNWGTLNEIILSVMYQKPIVFLKGTMGFSDMFTRSEFFKHVQSDFFITEDEIDAVKHAFRLAQK